MSGFVYLGILLLLALASPIFAFDEEPYNGVSGEDDDGNDVGQDYGGPPVDESPRSHPPFRKGGAKVQGAQCRVNGECRDRLNCCRTTKSLRTQCWPCLAARQACQRKTDCAHPLVCSQKIDLRTRRPIGRRRCVALPLNRPPPADEQIMSRTGK